MKLLVLKSRDKYIRFKDGAYRECGLDRASVFPMSQVDKVAGHLERLAAAGYPRPRAAALLIREVPYTFSEEDR